MSHEGADKLRPYNYSKIYSFLMQKGTYRLSYRIDRVIPDVSFAHITNVMGLAHSEMKDELSVKINESGDSITVTRKSFHSDCRFEVEIYAYAACQEKPKPIPPRANYKRDFFAGDIVKRIADGVTYTVEYTKLKKAIGYTYWGYPIDGWASGKRLSGGRIFDIAIGCLAKELELVDDSGRVKFITPNGLYEGLDEELSRRINASLPSNVPYPLPPNVGSGGGGGSVRIPSGGAGGSVREIYQDGLRSTPQERSSSWYNLMSTLRNQPSNRANEIASAFIDQLRSAAPASLVEADYADIEQRITAMLNEPVHLPNINATVRGRMESGSPQIQNVPRTNEVTCRYISARHEGEDDE